MECREGSGGVFIARERSMVVAVHGGDHGARERSIRGGGGEVRGGVRSSGVRQRSRSSASSGACRGAVSWAESGRRRRACHGGTGAESRRGGGVTPLLCGAAAAEAWGRGVRGQGGPGRLGNAGHGRGDTATVTQPEVEDDVIFAKRSLDFLF